MNRLVLTVVTPAYNEALNLPALYERLARVLAGLDWEWIVVDDHSTDETFAAVERFALMDPRVRGIRLARNVGSHAAIACGLDHARGDAAAVLAADLQDPPEILPPLLDAWRAGGQVVWAARAGREGASLMDRGLSRCYHALMRRMTGVTEMPETGADCFLLDRVVVEALRRFGERHASLLALITWMGFRQVTVPYAKQARLHGRSGWTLAKKINLLVDSITSFTYLPIRLMTCVGVAIALLGFVYAAVVVVNAWAGRPVQGWSSLMVAVLVLGGVQMLMMGILGEYLWRALDEARRRPRYLIETTTGRPREEAAAEVQGLRWD